MTLLHEHLSASQEGVLQIGGLDATALLRTYGSPLTVMDEDRLRANCACYREALKAAFDGRAMALYASKAASFKQIYRIVGEEGLGVDVVSSGELYTALEAGFAAEKIYFHSNNKTDEDLRYALDSGVGCIVLDNREEMHALADEAARRGIRARVMVRLTPGIDPHTFEAVATGQVDSKFGVAIETGQAEEFVAELLTLPSLELLGFHAHVGSQVFDSEVFLKAAAILLQFAADMRDRHGYTFRQLNLGGGFGVRYVEEDPHADVAANIREIGDYVKARCAELALELPEIRMEPGRSIVADTAVTLYTVGSVKQIPGYRSYVAVDGGMTDNPRYALYGAKYTVLLANKLNEPADFACSLVGRCCESGDVLQENVLLPASVQRGDVVAMLSTGAYQYSMASNYNRIPRLPIVMVRQGEPYLAVRRETLADLVKCDL